MNFSTQHPPDQYAIPAKVRNCRRHGRNRICHTGFLNHSPEPFLLRAARWFAFGSAASVLFSIAVCQILLALSFAALLMSGARLRLPRIWLPLGLFILGTLISLALSGNPAAGLPQVRKIYVFLELVVIFSTFRDLALVRRLVLCWTGIGAIVALRALVQYAQKVQEAHALGRNFYDYYMTERISGFMSHWMTFSGQEMFVFLMLLSFLLFAPGAGRRGLLLWVACGSVVGVAIVLGFTRSIVWLALPAGGLYLIWFWRRSMVLAVPVVLLAGVLVAPASVRERFDSIFQPRKNVDSNDFRKVTLRTGLEMIKAHPWFGLGPEEVKTRFNEFVPPDIPRPLPTGWYGHLHNIYVHYAAERGIPTMLALVWMLVQIPIDFLTRLRKLPPGRSDVKFVLHGAVAVVIATMLGGLFELNLGDSEVLTMFLTAVACGYVALDVSSGEKAESAVV